MGGWVGVVSAREVPVVGGDDCVLLSFLHVLSVPLPDARPARIGQHHTPHCLQSVILHVCACIYNMYSLISVG